MVTKRKGKGVANLADNDANFVFVSLSIAVIVLRTQFWLLLDIGVLDL